MQVGVANIPEYAKTGLDMANFFGVTQNGNQLDYGQFFITDNNSFNMIMFHEIIDVA